MKIALTSNGNDLDAPPTGTFGRCPCFLIIDTKSGVTRALPNPAASAGGGAGVQAAQAVADTGVDAVLTGHVGPHAMEVLQRAKIRVYDLGGADARTALERFRAGDLPEIADASNPRGGRGLGR